MAVKVQQGVLEGSDGSAALAWSVAQAPKSQDSPNGDGYLLTRDGDRIMLAVVDGVGSGRDAHAAAEVCLRALRTEGGHEPGPVFDRCHKALEGTRGAALALISVDLATARLVWAAVGDIDGCVFRGQDGKSVASMVQKAGTLGHHYSGIHLQDHALLPGDLVAVSSDGVSRRYRDQLPDMVSPGQFAESCLGTFGRANDDRTFAVLSFQKGGA